jgi:hypothetical protein
MLDMESGITILEHVTAEYFGKPAIVLIDEYDQPVISSYQYGYREQVGTFFENFYGESLKGAEDLDHALLTGIQRVVKESIFSKLNNVKVYTVLNEKYSSYFGLDTSETEELLRYYGLELNEDVKHMYDGYNIGGTDIYNPWSILNYADEGKLIPHWVNTSTNYLVKQALETKDEVFNTSYEALLRDGPVEVPVRLETSFIELQNTETLWGLLINSGYLTATDMEYSYSDTILTLRIPNGEVKSEFRSMLAQRMHVNSLSLNRMLKFLTENNVEAFFKIYQSIVLTCTSFFDAKENAYHMLFLGMCLTLGEIYKITSNMEGGYGRSDILMESRSSDRPHIIIEFKQGEDIERLGQEALDQIISREYYAGLSGQVLCMGIAHDVKRCEIVHRLVTIGVI